MLCLLCGATTLYDLGKSLPAEEILPFCHKLCTLMELDPKEYATEMLSVAVYCNSCIEEVQCSAVLVNSQDLGCVRTLERTRRNMRRKFISSWVNLQSEDVHADNYCPWQSVRFRILLELGAVIEVVDDGAEGSVTAATGAATESLTDDGFFIDHFYEESAAPAEEIPPNNLEVNQQGPAALVAGEAGEIEGNADDPLYLGMAREEQLECGGTSSPHLAEMNPEPPNENSAIPSSWPTEVVEHDDIPVEGGDEAGQSSAFFLHEEIVDPSQQETSVDVSVPTVEFETQSLNKEDCSHLPSFHEGSTPKRSKIAEGGSNQPPLISVSQKSEERNLEENAIVNKIYVEESLALRRSKRKPLRPTKGIYALHPATSAMQKPFPVPDLIPAVSKTGMAERSSAAASSNPGVHPDQNTNIACHNSIESIVRSGAQAEIVYNSCRPQARGDLELMEELDGATHFRPTESAFEEEDQKPSADFTQRSFTTSESVLSELQLQSNSEITDDQGMEMHAVDNSDVQPETSDADVKSLQRFSLVFNDHIARNNQILQRSPAKSSKAKQSLKTLDSLCSNEFNFTMSVVTSSLDSPPMSPNNIRESPGQVIRKSPNKRMNQSGYRRSSRKILRKKFFPIETPESPVRNGNESTSRRRNRNQLLDMKSLKRARQVSSVTKTDFEPNKRRTLKKRQKIVEVKNHDDHMSEDETAKKQVKYTRADDGFSRQFNSKERREHHFERKHQGIRNLFACDICGKAFPAKSRLQAHVERHKEAEKTYTCEQCEKSFPTQKKLNFHMYQHSQNWGLYCDVCNKGFPSGQEMRLANHRKIHDESRPRPYKCSTCSRTFSSQQYLDIHQKNHPIQPDEDGLYRCKVPSCRMSFKAVTSYREHQKIHTGELPFECEVCGKKFGYITGYKKHKISHTDEKHHICHICGKQFKQKGNLNLHIGRHNGVKPYACTHPGCSYSFFDQYKLKNHMDVHTGKRAYKCEDCKKSFRTTTGLKAHIAAVHAKERKYKCHCGKTFTQKQYLQFHKTQHPELNLKKFACDVCSKKFTEPSSLREHKRRFHTGETSFQCDVCDYTACFKSRMDKHMLTHSNPQFECSDCGQQFKQSNNLKRHVSTMHSDGKAKKGIKK